MQTQRLILWVIFSMSILFLWDAWQQHNGQPPLFGASPAQKSAEKPANPAASASSASVASAPQAPVDPSIPAAPAPTSAVPGGAASSDSAVTAMGRAPEPIRIRNDVLALDIDPVGAQIRRAELLKHRDTVAGQGNVILLDASKASTYLAQSGLIGASSGSFPTHRTPMQRVESKRPTEIGSGSNEAGVTLVAESGGLRVERTLKLVRGSYLLEVTDRLTNTGNDRLAPTLYLQLTRDNTPPPGSNQFYSTYVGPVIYTEAQKFQKVAFSDIDGGKPSHATQAKEGWLAIIQHYFLSAWIPQDQAEREYYTRKIDQKLYSVGTKLAVGELAPGASTTITNRLLVGPQDQTMLESIAPGLELVVDYGILTAIAKPIYWLLERLHELVGNWGWAIVLLTILIKTAFYPLQAASYRSMAKMKAVTPRLMALRERYGEDRVRLNQAMMELYKTEKINPLGGCLPIVVQIPVFISLYWVLLASVEMRDAPWIGWITDLASPDDLFGVIPGLDMPIGLLPILMAATMYIQIRLNPTPPDPIQARMMMILPLVFSVMFFFFPSGLVLYWLVNNIYSIAQQWLITRRFEQERAARAA
ncbi:MAG: Oxa1Ec [Pseudomonadota bacterium]|jgi:YidC/Oxa1 family membrane protein insertase